ncbi:hypothetical protein [Stutzerimonas kunmingensis]|uniref:hypothetical protein n=1 Tax=Stutzerimonas kunmingensis TaxID=1211807 RepID=UPI00241D0C93|nr:hypothetical protein [Stutzerimonas kunmingensis]
MAPSTRQEALEQAHRHLISLRHLLGLLQAWDERDELASVVKKTRSEIALLQETLEESIAARRGYDLMQAVSDFQRQQQETPGDQLFWLDELYEQDNAREPIALHRDLRTIEQAWGHVSLPEQLAERTAEIGLMTSTGFRTVEVLQKYFDRIRLDS